MRDPQRPTSLSAGAGNPTFTDTGSPFPTGVSKAVEDARQKKQDGLEFPQNVCRPADGVNCYRSLGNSRAMPVCPCWRTGSVLHI